MIPGWGQAVGDAAGPLVNGIRGLINPNYDYQQQFEQALSDPMKAQQIADQYATNPTLFDPNKIGQKNTERLKSLTQSADSKNKNTKAAATSTLLANPKVAADVARIAQGLSTATNEAKSEAELRAAQVEEEAGKRQFAAYMALPEDVRQRAEADGYSSKINGLTPDQNESRKLALETQKRQQNIITSGDDWLKANPKVDILKIAQAIRSGNPDETEKLGLDGVTLGALLTGSKISDQLKTVMDVLDNQDKIKAQAEAQIRGINAAGDRQDKSYQRQLNMAETKANETNETTVKRILTTGSATLTSTMMKIIREINSNDPRHPPPSDEQLAAQLPILQKQIDDVYAATNREGQAPRAVLIPSQDGGWWKPKIKANIGYIPDGSDKPVVLDRDGINKVFNPTKVSDLIKPTSEGGGAEAGVINAMRADVKAGKHTQAELDALIKYYADLKPKGK